MKIGLNVYPLNSAHKDRGVGYYTKRLLEYLKKDESVEVVEFNNITSLKKVDIVHYPWFDLFFPTLPLRKKYPTVVTIHDVIPLIFADHYPVGIKGRINLFRQKISLRGSKHIITDSETSQKDISKYLNISSGKISTIYLGVSKAFKPLHDTQLLHIKRVYKLPDRFLLYVGDANWVKNLPFLIEGFSKIIKKAKLEEVKLVLVGGVFLKNVDNINHPELESLKRVNKLIQQLHLEDKIIKIGNINQDDLVGFYNLATIYIQPSFYEGFGLPLLEAFACGTPVVCSNKGSLPEVGGDAALYFDPTNIDQFTAVISDLLQN
ncbi:glycosyltransferase family 4 protein [Candidatus Daviesbacteria bacterium]|nr:glycosyltransferase family 4 protein [Candidatus Daviesbacteria bacterium]